MREPSSNGECNFIEQELILFKKGLTRAAPDTAPRVAIQAAWFVSSLLRCPWVLTIFAGPRATR